MIKCNYDIIPLIEKKDLEEKYKDHSAEWLLFTNKCHKNNFVKEYLLQKYNHVCQYCNFEIKKTMQVHHVSYDNVCAYPEIIVQPNPTAKRPNRTDKVPNCQRCFLEHPEQFEKCMSLLRPIHTGCNVRIDEKQKESQ